MMQIFTFRRTSRMYSTEALSLLQTPPVFRKSAVKSDRPLLTHTPHSILKVKQTSLRRSPSPLKDMLKAKQLLAGMYIYPAASNGGREGDQLTVHRPKKLLLKPPEFLITIFPFLNCRLSMFAL